MPQSAYSFSSLVAALALSAAGCSHTCSGSCAGTGPLSDGATPTADGGGGSTGALFPPGSPWYTDVSNATLDAESATVISGIQKLGGWGNCNVFQIDFGLAVLQADANAPMRSFTPNGNWFSPDCDNVPVPVPPGGVLEGETGYQCLGGGDCHLLVVDRPLGKLYEMWSADIQSASVFNGGCLAVWDMTRVYPPSGRGDQCTSADAAGYPMTPLLVNSDEVYAAINSGVEIGHALRFVLPNTSIRNGVYVHPATHSSNLASGDASTPPYGAHFRLHANYPLQNLPNDAARAVARAFQKYGMFLADGGEIALTFQSDQFNTHKWADMNFDTLSLSAIQVGDFDMVDGGQRIPYTGNCVRNP
jgi:serine/threonine-protein kinase